MYDGENRQTSYRENNVEKGSYSYDGDGRRVKKVAGGVTTIFVYNAGGQLIAEYSDSNQSSAGGVRYLTADHLGSTRIVSDSAGAVKERHDYLPFGEEIGSYVSGRANVGIQDYKVGDVRQKFTQKERDSETGLDFFEARYYANSQGRFTSVDPVALTRERLVDPQRINLYSYCRNNPLVFIDPTGEIITFANEDARKKFEEYVKFLNSNKEKYANELATVNQLQKSEVEYHISVGGKDFEGDEGNTTTDGQRINVAISNVGGPKGEKFSLNSRFAHELEHARQFDSGEFTFEKGPDGKWHPNYTTYDIGDEVKAWKAQLNTSINNDFYKSNTIPREATLLLKYAEAKTDDERAGILARNAYPRRNPRQNSNFVYGGSENYKPGQLIRTNNFFGRVNSISKPPSPK